MGYYKGKVVRQCASQKVEIFLEVGIGVMSDE